MIRSIQLTYLEQSIIQVEFRPPIAKETPYSPSFQVSSIQYSIVYVVNLTNLNDLPNPGLYAFGFPVSGFASTDGHNRVHASFAVKVLNLIILDSTCTSTIQNLF